MEKMIINNLCSLKKRFFVRLFDLIWLFLLTLIFKFFLNYIINDSQTIWVDLGTWFFFIGCFFVFNIFVPYVTNGYTIFKAIFKIRLYSFYQKKFHRLKFLKLFCYEIMAVFIPMTIFFILLSLKEYLELDIFKRMAIVFLTIWFLLTFLLLKIDKYQQSFWERYFNFYLLSSSFVRIKNKKHLIKMKGYLYNLNEQQQKCVVFDKKTNLRILAGPGTGKTTVLIERFIYLVKELQFLKSEILVLTFTRKATQNFANKLQDVFKNTSSFVFKVYTYHGFCYQFLKREIAFYQNETRVFTVLDRRGQKKIFRKILEQDSMSKKLNEDTKNIINDLLKVVDFLQKNNVLTFKDLQKNVLKQNFQDLFGALEIEFVYQFYQKYLRYKKLHFLFDYVDLLLETIRILRENRSLCLKYQNFFKYLMIDEFQDIDALQYHLVRLLSCDGKKIKITIVGDPDQNIYQWRGAQIKFILDFNKHFQPSKTIALTYNYRSTDKILKLANTLILNNQNRLPKVLKGTKDKGENIKIFYEEKTYLQGEWIVKEIKKLQSANVSLKDIAILYRVNNDGAVLEKNFLQAKIPYLIFKGSEFFKRQEIKILLTYLAIVLEPKNYYLEEILLKIPGLGQMTLAKILEASSAKKVTLFDYLVCEKPSFLSETIYQKIIIYLRLLQRLMTFLHQKHSLKEFVKEIYETFLKEELKRELLYKAREANVEILLNDLIVTFETKPTSKNLTLAQKINNFLGEIAFQSFQEQKFVNAQITLMTMHSSKGLEFRYVFIFNVSNDYLKFKFASQLEEERRLFFVAITRAKEQLFITGKFFEESLFLKEIKKERSLLDIKNAKRSVWVI